MINKLHGRALRIVFNDHISDLEVRLHKSNDIFSHHKNIQLIIQLDKIRNEFAPPIKDSMLNRRNITISEIERLLAERKVTGFWTLLRKEIKQRNMINLFKRDIKQWICKTCPKRVFTKPSIYLAYGSYLGTTYNLNCNCFLPKVFMIYQTQRCMLNNNNRNTSKACWSSYVKQ